MRKTHLLLCRYFKNGDSILLVDLLNVYRDFVNEIVQEYDIKDQELPLGNPTWLLSSTVSRFQTVLEVSRLANNKQSVLLMCKTTDMKIALHKALLHIKYLENKLQAGRNFSERLIC